METWLDNNTDMLYDKLKDYYLQNYKNEMTQKDI